MVQARIASNLEYNCQITASRFILQSDHLPGPVEEARMVTELREISDKYSATIFHPFFPYFDQYLAIGPSTRDNVLISVVAVMAVCLLLLGGGNGESGSVVTTVVVATSVFSIELGVFASMAWPLGVSLDVVSMIILVMCVGFSVDFSAHIANHFTRSDGTGTPAQRLAKTLSAYGPPVAQAALSTSLAVLPLAFTPSYILRSFALMVLTVVVTGTIHGIVVVPVMLSVWYGLRQSSYFEVIGFSPRKVLTKVASCLMITTKESKEWRKDAVADVNKGVKLRKIRNLSDIDT